MMSRNKETVARNPAEIARAIGLTGGDSEEWRVPVCAAQAIAQDCAEGKIDDPDELKREVLYPVLDWRGIKRTPRADGFHAFRRAASKYLRKASGRGIAAVQLGRKRMTTTDEHYNDRDLDDLTKAAELVESAFISSFAPDC